MVKNINLEQYQIEGIQKLIQMNGRALLADHCGMGKTIQAVGYLEHSCISNPGIVLSPANNKYKWAETFQEHSDLSYYVCEGQKAITAHTLPDVNVYIVNYDILHYWYRELLLKLPKTLIMDESHELSNNKSKKTKAAYVLSRHVKHCVGVSATPMRNVIGDLFPTLNMIKPKIFTNKMQFLNAFTIRRKTKYGWDYSTGHNEEKLNYILEKSVLIRRTPESKKKTIETVIPLDIGNRVMYNKMEDDFLGYLRNNDSSKLSNEKNTVLKSKTEALKQCAAIGKLAGVFSWVDRFLKTEEKLVLVGWHKHILNQIYERYKDIALKIDGSISSKKKYEYSKIFNTSKEVQLIAANIKSAGVALDLDGASTLAFVELVYSPTLIDQCKKRIDRYTQTAEELNVYYFIARDTIEQRQMQILDNKRITTDKVIDNKETVYTELLNQMYREARR